MREIVLDTETTGLDPADAHRILEIGCVELENHLPNGRTYHQYINPDREVPDEAARVHGLTTEKLVGEPLFDAIAGEFLEFIGDAQLIIHNADFDIKFLNFELSKLGMPEISMNRVTDTLTMARKKFPGSPASLDALCKRFDVDNANRTLHGALLDSELLAEVYLELIGGRQVGFNLASRSEGSEGQQQSKKKREFPRRSFDIPADDLANHQAFVKGLKNPLWEKV
jgi:DNA polymerase-3 subunit epsilon